MNRGPFDIAFLGQYTKDTIVNATGTRVNHGGAYFYGASVAARLGLRTAAVTRLAKEDFPAFRELEELGVAVFAKVTAASTCLRLEYPSSNPDERRLSVNSVAEPFGPGDVAGLKAAIWSIGASLRGEVGLPVLRALLRSGARLGLDVQGYVRVVREGGIVHEAWPEQREILGLVDFLKADSVEAEMLTGTSDLCEAAGILADQGPRELVLTHRDGVLVYVGGRFHEAAFKPEKLVGRSGRGDTCMASYLCMRRSLPPEEAVLWAAAVTSLKMESDGPFRGTPEEVQRMIREKYRA